MPRARDDTSHTRETPPPPWISDPARHPLITSQAKEIATRIFARIASGAYPYGTRIPAERELAVEFHETRATIRQALDFLATYEVVARRAGSGTFVSYRHPVAPARGEAAAEPGELTIHQLADMASPFAMSVAESILEPEMVRLATISMSTRDIKELGTQLAALEAIITESDRFAAIENDFMMMIARGTHNSLIVAMYAILHEVRRQPQWSAAHRETLTPAKIRSTQMLLRSLHDAIAQRNVETAVELIKLHIASTHEEMIYET